MNEANKVDIHATGLLVAALVNVVGMLVDEVQKSNPTIRRDIYQGVRDYLNQVPLFDFDDAEEQRLDRERICEEVRHIVCYGRPTRPGRAPLHTKSERDIPILAS